MRNQLGALCLVVMAAAPLAAQSDIKIPSVPQPTLIAEPAWNGKYNEKVQTVESTDRKSRAYSVLIGEYGKDPHFRLVLENRAGKSYSPEFIGMGDIAISPSGESAAYVAGVGTRKKMTWHVGTITPQGQFASPGYGGFAARPTFSPDGQWLVYRGQETREHVIYMTDTRFSAPGKAEPARAFVFELVWSPKSDRVIHWTELSRGKLVMTVFGTDGSVSEGPVMLGMEEDLKYSPKAVPTFSKDGAHFYYRAIHAEQGSVLVIDNQMMKDDL